MPELLTVSDIMGRYNCERQAASRIMDKMPVLRVGKRKFIRAADLMDWEESRTEYPVTIARRTKPTTNKIARRKY